MTYTDGDGQLPVLNSVKESFCNYDNVVYFFDGSFHKKT